MAEELLTYAQFRERLGNPSETLIIRALSRIEGRTGQSRQPVQDPYDARSRKYPARWLDEVKTEIATMTGATP